MAGLARLMLTKGKIVCGSDLKKSDELSNLTKLGVKVFYGHKKKNISKDIDLVVFSGAIKENNIELLTAKSLGIKTMERSEFLGEITKLYKNVIAVTGTHGKTTTTAIIGKIFQQANLNPTIHIGGDVIDFDSNIVIGSDEFFITEACEYRESFKYINPNTTVITNIEPDHLDFYKTFDNLKVAFNKFANNTSDNLVMFDNKYINIENKSIKAFNIGLDGNKEFSIFDITQTDKGYRFKIKEKDIGVYNFEINKIGYHNVINTVIAIVVAILYGIDINIIKRAVSQFLGVKRRYEQIGYILDTPIICDYAHHPTEIENSIKGIKDRYKRILCVFQPHTYTRTANLITEFTTCFNLVERLIIFKTYPARERVLKEGKAIVLFRKVLIKNKYYVRTNSKLFQNLKNCAPKFDVILVLGAGDIYTRVKKVIFSKKIC